MRLLAGKTRDEMFSAGRAPLEGFAPVKIGLAPEREELYARIQSRIDGMVRAGWIEEVAGLVQRGIAPEAKPFQFIGYADWREYLDGKVSRDEAVKKIQQATRQICETAGDVVPSRARRQLAGRIRRGLQK